MAVVVPPQSMLSYLNTMPVRSTRAEEDRRPPDMKVDMASVLKLFDPHEPDDNGRVIQFPIDVDEAYEGIDDDGVIVGEYVADAHHSHCS